MPEIGIGIVGGGYMGRAHAMAMSVVGATFGAALRPRLEMIAASSPASAERHRAALGFRRAAPDWQSLVADPEVAAVIVASPPETHREIAEAALASGKHVFCEKPLALTLAESRAMVRLAEGSGRANMVGFNYIRTPASQFVRKLLAEGALGRITFFRMEHTEDFFSDPDTPHNWRCEEEGTGNLGDLAPHPVNAALALMGPVARLVADMQTVHTERPGGTVRNDDQAQLLMRFASGAMGHLLSSRVATGRKMGFAYEITGTRGAIRFDQEDQNAVHLYLAEGPEALRGFRKILMGPAHPDFAALCPGVGHGTGYQEQIVIEARDFLKAIETGQPVWPTFRDGLEVAEVIEAARMSARKGRWVEMDEVQQ